MMKCHSEDRVFPINQKSNFSKKYLHFVILIFLITKCIQTAIYFATIIRHRSLSDPYAHDVLLHDSLSYARITKQHVLIFTNSCQRVEIRIELLLGLSSWIAF